MIPEESTRQRGAVAARQRHQRQREDLGISTDIILRSVAPIGDLIRALEGVGGCARLVAALRSELARRRSGGRA
jgi:hypothetical protein